MKPEVAEPQVKDLYDQDFFEWTQRNAELLRAGRFAEADIAHIAEEVEDMGKSQQRELQSRLAVLVMHLLKWKFQPGGRGPSWRATINTQRRDIADLMESMPGLRRAFNLPKAYARAVADAVDETELPANTFPAKCPFPLDEILDTGFWPE